MASLPPLTDQELWSLDTQGYVVCPHALNREELAALAGDDDDLLAGLASHPTLTRYANLLCASVETSAGRLTPDTSARVDRAPRLLQQVSEPTQLFGGNGRRDLSRAYFHLHGWDRWTGHNAGRATPMAGSRQESAELALDPRDGFVGQKEIRVRITQGLLVIVALSDAPAGAGGFVLIPASHNSEVDTPASLRERHVDPLGMLRQVPLQAGDALLVLSSTLHGMQPWRDTRHPQRLAMVEFISRSAPPSSDSAAFVPKSDRPAWVDELDAASRAVVWPFDMDDGNAVPVSDGTRLRLMSSAELQSQPAIAQPSLYQLAPPPTLQHDEMFFFDTNGYLLLKHVMDAEWLAEARAAIAAHETEVVTTDAFTDPTQSDALRGEAGVKQRVYNGGPTVALPEPHCLPFRRMLTHPGVLGRIQWMLGAGFVATNTGGMLASAVGSQGQFMHSGNTNPTDEGHTYRMQNGRVLLTVSVNVEWVLTHSPVGAGGFIVSAGSHKANYPPPHGVRKAQVLDTVEQVAMDAGDVLIFLGASVTHGALPWRREDEPRRVALFAYQTRATAGAGRPFEGPRL